MISLSHSLSLAEHGEAPKQSLWYEEDGEYFIFPETAAYLQALAREGKSFYVLALHKEFREDPVLDFFLSASSVESLRAVLRVMDFHKKLFKPWVFIDGVMTPLLQKVETRWFIGPVGLPM
jgi:hypothetical protein